MRDYLLGIACLALAGIGRRSDDDLKRQRACVNAALVSPAAQRVSSAQ
jgi:hypothetical protein